MIYYVATARFSSTIRRLRAGGGPQFRSMLRLLTYEELFFERAGPIGHYIFTDFDRLTRYEIETAARFADALRVAVPEARILNDPVTAMERLPLLVALHKAGINDFTAVRIENGARPDRYPVFIRAEDGYGGPETPVIHDEAGYVAALADLARRGLPQRGRIAVGYQAEADERGLYRKYGAFKIGDAIIPQHLMRSKDWVVKRDSQDAGAEEAAEELRFIRDNPHREILQRAFAVGRLDFGRVDYGVIGGRVQVYEINTNPSFPRFAKIDLRSERRDLIHAALLAAFAAIDTPLLPRGRIRFSEARPREVDIRLPRRRLLISLARRVGDAKFGGGGG